MGLITKSIFRTLFAVIVGVVLIVWPEAAGTYIVILVGLGFFLPALFSIISYLAHLNQKSDESAPELSFPFVALGSLLLGFWLMINPSFFVQILMYLLGAGLIFSGLALIIKLISYRRSLQVKYGYFVLPTFLVLVGLLVLYNPFEVASIPFVLLGVSCIVYAVSNSINDYKFRCQELKVIEEITEDEPSSPEEAEVVSADETPEEKA